MEKNLNCSQIVFNEVCKNCHKKICEDENNMLGGISAGFGVGNICSGIVGAMCAMGLFFDEYEMKSIRVQFIVDFNEKFGSLDCSILCQKGIDCQEILEFSQKWTEKKIMEYQK